MVSVLGSPTFEYFGVSDNSKVRHIEEVLGFFSGFPRIIRIEGSRMANPAFVIQYLATNLAPRKRRELRNRFIIGFLFWTGVRVNEFTGTRREDIDLIGRTFNVPTLKQKRRKRGGGKVMYRPIPLDHVPAAELRLWYSYLYNVKDRVIDRTDRQVERIVKTELGQEFTPHTLRHGLGLWLYEYTKDIRVVSQVLRHTNIANTLIYTRLSLEAIREKIRL